MKRLVASLLLFASIAAAGTPDSINPFPTPGASFFSQLLTWLKNEMYNERREIGVGAYFVVCGCLDHVGPGLTHTPDACIAYTAGYRITETQSIVYPDGSTCFVVAEQGTVGDITAPDTTLWTRVPGTHYMLNCTGGGSAPVTGMKIFSVVTTGGSVTAVTDLRPLYPVDTADITDGSITRAKLAPGVTFSSTQSTTAFSTFSLPGPGVETTFVTMPAVTSTGVVELAGQPSLEATCTSGGEVDVFLHLYRDGVQIDEWQYAVTSGSVPTFASWFPIPFPTYFDSPSPGSHTYRWTLSSNGSCNLLTISGNPGRLFVVAFQ